MGKLVTEDREAEVGERILITDSKDSRYEDGDIFTVSNKVFMFVQVDTDSDGDPVHAYLPEYEVIVEDTLTDKHRKERLQAAKKGIDSDDSPLLDFFEMLAESLGEEQRPEHYLPRGTKVFITDPKFSRGEYGRGDVLTVASHSGETEYFKEYISVEETDVPITTDEFVSYPMTYGEAIRIHRELHDQDLRNAFLEWLSV